MMRVNYTGGNGEFTARDKERIDSRLAKLGKRVDRKSECEAHVILSEQRRSKIAEVTMNFLHTSFVASGSGPAYVPALTAALDKMEKQIDKTLSRMRDGKRNGGKVTAVIAAEVTKPVPAPAGPRVYPAKVSKKPMNIDEAVLVALRKKVNYVAFRDAESGGISIVVQRPDGNFDLVTA